MARHRRIDHANKSLKFWHIGKCPATGKLIYETRKIAKQNKAYLHDKTLRTYKCDHCQGFHLGHTGGLPRQHHRKLHAG